MKRFVLLCAGVLLFCAVLGLAFQQPLRGLFTSRNGPSETTGDPASEGVVPETTDTVIESLDARPLGSSSDNKPIVTEWDFGTVLPATELRHRFSLTNKTNRTLTIRFVSTTCACTVGEFSSKSIQPAESTWIKIALRTPARDGDVHQSIVVEFAEAGVPVVYLVIKGEIRSALAAVPLSVDFGRVSPGPRLRHTIELRNYSERDVTITEVQAPEWLAVEHAPVADPDPRPRLRQAWQLVLLADTSKLPAGPANATVVVHTNSAVLAPLVIPVNLLIKAPLEAVPNHLNFRHVDKGRTSQKTLLLEVSPELGELTEKDFVLTLPTDLKEELDVKIAPTDLPHRFMLVANLVSKKADRLIEEELEISLREQKVPPVRVRISANVR